MNITLHTAADQVRALLEQLDPETGELPPEFEHARELVENKAQAVVAFIIENEKQADMIDAYCKEMTARVRAARKRSQWLKQYLSAHMARAGVLSIEDDRGLFRCRLEHERDPSVDVFSVDQLPLEYIKRPVTEVPDKLAIMAALKAGHDVPGAKIVRHDRLTIK